MQSNSTEQLMGLRWGFFLFFYLFIWHVLADDAISHRVWPLDEASATEKNENRFWIAFFLLIVIQSDGKLHESLEKASLSLSFGFQGLRYRAWVHFGVIWSKLRRKFSWAEFPPPLEIVLRLIRRRKLRHCENCVALITSHIRQQFVGMSHGWRAGLRHLL